MESLADTLRGDGVPDLSHWGEERFGAFPAVPSTVERHQYRAKIQPVGDHSEISIRLVDVANVGRLDYLRWTGEIGRARGKRQAPAERDPEDLVRAARRARQMLRLRATHLGVDRLFTVTSRGLLTSRDEAQVAWSEFSRRMRTKYPAAQWIAVPEPHKSGAHWHVHFASRGYLDVKVLRRAWHAVLCKLYGLKREETRGEAAPGNIDVSYKGGAFGVRLVRKIAGYLAKYLGKTADAAVEVFNKKRYWCSMGIQLPKSWHVWLDDDSIEGAVRAVCKRLGYWQDGESKPCFEVWTPSRSFAYWWVDPAKVPDPPF